MLWPFVIPVRVKGGVYNKICIMEPIVVFLCWARYGVFPFVIQGVQGDLKWNYGWNERIFGLVRLVVVAKTKI